MRDDTDLGSRVGLEQRGVKNPAPTAIAATKTGSAPLCRIVPFIPGRRPTDEDTRPGLGSSDPVELVTGGPVEANRAILLLELGHLPDDAQVDVSVSIDGQALPNWKRRPLELTSDQRQRIVLHPERDLAEQDMGFTKRFLRRATVDVSVRSHEQIVASDAAHLDVCDVRNLGSLYKRVIDRLVAPDTTRQAKASGVPDPGFTYHPWYPVLHIGGDKAALYTLALVADIVDKKYHLTDPAWLLRVGVYLELLTCVGIFEAVRDEVGDLLEPHEREAFESADEFTEIRQRIDVAAWRDVWSMHKIRLPRRGSPRLGPVSPLNLLKKKNATLRFLHTHHDDLKHAIELAGPNHRNSQETWQRVFRDAERAVLRQTAAAFPELGFLPAPAREVVLWQRLGFAGQQGVYPTACNQYRASMNMVADWAKSKGLMDHAGAECVPAEVSLLEAYTKNPAHVGTLQRSDGLSPRLDVPEPAEPAQPTVEEIEQLLHEVPIFRMVPHEELHSLALSARPLLLGPTRRFVVQGQEGTSLFLVAEGTVEVRLRNPDGTDWLADTMGRGAVVGEMSLLTGEPRSATVRSVGETVVYEIGRQQYEPLLKSHPEWVDELASVMEDRLARRQERIADLQVPRRGALAERIRRNFFGPS